MAASSASFRSCPNAGEWAERFRKAENVITITISSKLTGSYDAAEFARTIVTDEHARTHRGHIMSKNIFVLGS